MCSIVPSEKKNVTLMLFWYQFLFINRKLNLGGCGMVVCEYPCNLQSFHPLSQPSPRAQEQCESHAWLSDFLGNGHALLVAMALPITLSIPFIPGQGYILMENDDKNISLVVSVISVFNSQTILFPSLSLSLSGTSNKTHSKCGRQKSMAANCIILGEMGQLDSVWKKVL